VFYPKKFGYILTTGRLPSLKIATQFYLTQKAEKYTFGGVKHCKTSPKNNPVWP
jgi:hypothetical protein